MRAPDADPRSFSSAPHLGFLGATARHRMGVRRLDAGAWLEPDDHRAWQLAEKRRLVTEDRDRYVHQASTPAAVRGVEVLVDLVRTEVGDDEGVRRPGADGVGGIEWCGLATQEDWCVMVREDTWRLRAACVCFPSRWVLAEKVGGTIAGIHGPVRRYEDELGGQVESFFDRLGPDRVVWRTNWNLWDDPRLSQSFREEDAVRWDPPAPAEVGDRVFLRVERQTLRRLTDDAIAFSIRVHQRPLRTLAEEEGAITGLRAAIDEIDRAGRSAKKLGHLEPAIRAWLDDPET